MTDEGRARALRERLGQRDCGEALGAYDTDEALAPRTTECSTCDEPNPNALPLCVGAGHRVSHGHGLQRTAPTTHLVAGAMQQIRPSAVTARIPFSSEN
jgi:hypothetical protein